jgi:hypothetical protein
VREKNTQLRVCLKNIWSPRIRHWRYYLPMIILQGFCWILSCPSRCSSYLSNIVTWLIQPGTNHIIQQFLHLLHQPQYLGCKWEGNFSTVSEHQKSYSAETCIVNVKESLVCSCEWLLGNLAWSSWWLLRILQPAGWN